MHKVAFDYKLRVSPRSRNVRLRVTVRNGLEVVIPRGYDPDKVPNILERKKGWVRSALERAEAHRKFFEPEPKWTVPHQITLPALSKTWYVFSKPTASSSVSVRKVDDARLLVFGAIQNERACRDALTRWLMRITREHLVPQLHELSTQMGLRFRRTFVKRPKTRWASCSRHRSISLNAKLLFLPPELVDYVMVHELCHLVEMNHSKRFWGLVMQHRPEFRKLDARLREMWKSVPRWALEQVTELRQQPLENDCV
jgi:predicted metal-dependent hydrolase